MSIEIEERGEILQLVCLMPRVGQPRLRVAQIVEERMNHGVDGAESLRGGVLEKTSDQIDRIGVRLAEHLIEGMRLDLGELVLHVVRIHGSDLLTRRGSQHLDDFHELVDA